MAYVASYGAGSWSAVPVIQEADEMKLSPKEQRFVFGPGCRNNTSHPHEMQDGGALPDAPFTIPVAPVRARLVIRMMLP